jgi:hypothetical protein
MNKVKRMIMMVMVGATLLAACTKEEATDLTVTGNKTSDELLLEKASPTGLEFNFTVDSAEIAMLQFMREEEYMAYDAYTVFWQQYGYNIFNNIKQSEYTHTSAIKNLLIKYGIEDPAATHQLGIFQNEEIQALYDSLIASGSQSGQLAIEAGVAIETQDIQDIQKGLLVTDQKDIKQVLNNLMKGSYNHLAAFNSWLN